MHALACGGVDVIELGLPFDPITNGPTIQAAIESAYSVAYVKKVENSAISS